MTDFTGIQFKFETLSYCGIIKEYSLNYYECPKRSENLVNFNKTAAPDAYTQVEHILGDCTENAVRNIVDTPIMDCWFNGTFEGPLAVQHNESMYRIGIQHLVLYTQKTENI